MQEIRQGQFYRDLKNRLYQIIAVAEHSETGEQMVVYQALYENFRVFVCSYHLFVAEVDHKKYPDLVQKYCFELVDLQSKETRIPNKKLENIEEENDEQENFKTDFFQPKEAHDGLEEGINPILLEFLDAETLEKKMHIMVFYRNKMDENLLNNIAISLDLVVEKKGTQEKYDEIMNCLSMMKHFECNRFR